MGQGDGVRSGRRAGRAVGVAVLAVALVAQGAQTAGAVTAGAVTAGAVTTGPTGAEASSAPGGPGLPSPADVRAWLRGRPLPPGLAERLLRRLPAVRAVDLGLGADSSSAQEVTDSGWVLGTARFPAPERDYVERVFRWRQGVGAEYFPDDADLLTAHGVSERGDVAISRGSWRGGVMEAVLWRADGTVEQITPPGVRAYAADVNRHGDVVGHMLDPVDGWHAFLWRDGVLHDIGVIGPEGEVLQVNDRRDVLARRGLNTGATVWRDGVWTDLTPTGYGLDLDEKGNVLGVVGVLGPWAERTVVWERKGREMRALDVGLRALRSGVLGKDTVAGVLPPDDTTTWYEQGRALLAQRRGVTELPGRADADAATTVTAVSDLGVAVGYEHAGDGGSPQALAWVLGYPVELGDVPGSTAETRWSQALDVNARGLVVGAADTGAGRTWPGPRSQAVVWNLVPTPPRPTPPRPQHPHP